MKLSIHQQAEYVTFTLTPHEDDRLEYRTASLARNTATLEMPNGFKISEVHPDLLGLASFIIASPWAAKQIEFPVPVSDHFANEVARVAKLRTNNVSTTVKKREPGKHPGLSFSGGVDSMAALELMPEDTFAMFSHRARPEKAVSLYNDAAPLYAVEEMNKAGQPVHKVVNDIEFMRKPVGFSVDTSPSVPLILLGDVASLNSVAFGTIAEFAYRTGTENFMNYTSRGFYLKWKGLFEAAGLWYNMLVSPISELGTMTIARQSRFAHLAQSCVRGEIGVPCNACIKCFRKQITEGETNGNWPSPEKVKSMVSVPVVRNYLSAAPIRFELILMESMVSYRGDDPILRALRDRVVHPHTDTSFIRGWYGPGLKEAVPELYYSETVEKINRFLPQMTRNQEESFENFDLVGIINDAKESGAVERWETTLAEMLD